MNYPQIVGGADGAEFKLQLVTKESVFYADENESDENSSVMCFNKEMDLESSNVHAYNELCKAALDTPSIEWKSESFARWQIALLLQDDPSEEKINKIAQIALDSFWKTVAEYFPEVMQGDFPWDADFKIQIAAEEAIKVWLKCNHPCHDENL
jgi:hypothetical protein